MDHRRVCAFADARDRVLAGIGGRCAHEHPQRLLRRFARAVRAQVNQVFAKEWQAKTNTPLEIRQSHGGSSKQARAGLEELQADVVTFNQVPVMFRSCTTRAISFPPTGRSACRTTVRLRCLLPIFSVRGRNPKQIKDWDDLVTGGVQAIFPEPQDLRRWPRSPRRGPMIRLPCITSALATRRKRRDFAKKLFANVTGIRLPDQGGHNHVREPRHRRRSSRRPELRTARYPRWPPRTRLDIVTPSVSFLAEFPGHRWRQGGGTRATRVLSPLPISNTSSAWRVRTSSTGISIGSATHGRPRNTPPRSARRSRHPLRTLRGWDAIAKEHLADGAIVDQIYVNK